MLLKSKIIVAVIFARFNSLLMSRDLAIYQETADKNNKNKSNYGHNRLLKFNKPRPGSLDGEIENIRGQKFDRLRARQLTNYIYSFIAISRPISRRINRQLKAFCSKVRILKSKFLALKIEISRLIKTSSFSAVPLPVRSPFWPTSFFRIDSTLKAVKSLRRICRRAISSIRNYWAFDRVFRSSFCEGVTQ